MPPYTSVLYVLVVSLFDSVHVLYFYGDSCYRTFQYYMSSLSHCLTQIMYCILKYSTFRDLSVRCRADSYATVQLDTVPGHHLIIRADSTVANTNILHFERRIGQ